MDGGQLPSPPMLGSQTTVADLAALLGTTYGKIRYFYYVKDIAGCYSEFSIPKKSGGERKIFAPNPPLATLQRKLAALLSHLYRPKDPAKAFIKGRSIVSNAKPHAGKAFVFNIDLTDFFPTISFARVRGLLMAPPYGLSQEVASVIAHLCTLRGSLPQGAPSSPILSNMICSRLDREMTGLAKKHRTVYTRYADDITFSFICPMRHLPDEIVRANIAEENHYGASPGDALEKIIASNGFAINPAKTRLQSRYERQVVTGLTVNRKPNIDRRYVRKTAAMIHSAEVLGCEAAAALFISKFGSEVEPVEFGAHIHGRMLFIHQVKGVESEVYVRLALRFNALDLRYKVPLPQLQSRANGLGEAFERQYSQRCWVVEIETESGYVQGSGFMISNNRLITSDHLFAKAGGVRGCRVSRLGFEKKYSSLMFYRCEKEDLAIIDFKEPEQFPHFEIGDENDVPKAGDRLSILGFPNHAPSKGLNRYWADVINRFSADHVEYVLIDKNIYSGNSGGAVVNAAQRVVGVAAIGSDDHPERFNAFICLRTLKKVIAEYDEIHT